jgi:hypothetical protein
MDVEIAEERVLVFADQLTEAEAEARAVAKRLEAFGAIARVAGFLARPKEDEFELVYREKRLQPFWRIASYAVSVYERSRDYSIALAPEVRAVSIDGQDRAIRGGGIVVTGQESCEEEMRRQALVDGLTGAEEPRLADYLDFAAAETDREPLAALAVAGVVIVPPTVRASGLIRDAVAKAIGKIDADKVLRELVRLEAVELYYRPIHAFRYRRANKEAVVEVDGLTGEVKTGGATFEQHLGKVLEPKFLLELGSEAANIFIPGANVARIAIVKGLELREKHVAARRP